jgi:rubrerythrin
MEELKKEIHYYVNEQHHGRLSMEDAEKRIYISVLAWNTRNQKKAKPYKALGQWHCAVCGKPWARTKKPNYCEDCGTEMDWA